MFMENPVTGSRVGSFFYNPGRDKAMPHWHESVARYKKNGGTEKLKKYDYTSYDEDTPYYTMIIREDGHKIKLLLDLNEELLHAMKTQYPEKVYFA